MPGISDYLEAAWLNMLRGTALTAPAAVYVKLHTADPSDDGTANAAANTTRQAVTFAAASSPGGTMASNAAVTWTSVPNAETYAWISLWDASTAGNCLWTGALSASKTVGVGDTFTIPSGSLTLTLA